jgi:hypothetical protein
VEIRTKLNLIREQIMRKDLMPLMKIMIIKKSSNETTKEIFNRIIIVEENLEIKNNRNTGEKKILIILSQDKVHNKIVSKKVPLVNVVMMK